jgi:hypothetical protein
VPHHKPLKRIEGIALQFRVSESGAHAETQYDGREDSVQEETRKEDLRHLLGFARYDGHYGCADSPGS